MSPRRNWGSPTPLSPASVSLPPEPESPNSDDLRKSLALCLLCAIDATLKASTVVMAKVH